MRRSLRPIDDGSSIDARAQKTPCYMIGRVKGQVWSSYKARRHLNHLLAEPHAARGMELSYRESWEF